MTQISAEIVADSINPWGDRITTLVLTFPRFILAELNTHRMFSRNSASSRAIPFKKMLEKLENDPFFPLAWQKEHSGMQGYEYFTDPTEIENCRALWEAARKELIPVAMAMNEAKITKQITNRLLEPFLWHRVLVTSTEWENFFDLRCPQYQDGDRVFRSREDLIHYHFHELKANRDVIDALDERTELDWLKINKSGAEIHISRLAECIWDAMNESTPKKLTYGEWHIPFGDNIDETELTRYYYSTRKDDFSLRTVTAKAQDLLDLRLKISTARCARTSYDNFEGTSDFEKDIKLYNSLFSSKHASPFEHCAQTMTEQQYATHVKSSNFDWRNSHFLYTGIDQDDLGWSRNFKGFIQYRELIKL